MPTLRPARFARDPQAPGRGPRPRPAGPTRPAGSIGSGPSGDAEAAAVAWQQDRAAAWSRVVGVGVFMGLLVVLGRVVQLQLAPAPEVASAVQARESTRTIAGLRGRLLDREGRPIATSIPGWRVFVDPDVAEAAGTLGTIAFDLAPLLGRDPIDLDRPLHEAIARRPGTRFVPLTDPLPAERVAPVRQAIRDGRLPGVALEPRPIRETHGGMLAPQLVGVTGFEGTGRTGLEFAWDQQLAGTDGRVRFRRSRSGRELWVGRGDHQPAEPGRDLMLSIDLVVQQIAEEELRLGVSQCNAQGGRIVVADPRTGEILAAYDMLQHRTDMDVIVPAHRERLNPGPDDPPLVAQASRLATEPYEPGSTFKPFVWAILTEDGLATPEEVLKTPGGPPGIRFGRRIIRDAFYYGPSSWSKVLVKSLNSGMVIVATRATHERLRERILDFGFAARTRVGIAGETVGIFTDAENWTAYTQQSVAMGHEIAVTPLQMVRAFMAFCNDGRMPELTLIARDPRDPAAAGGLRRVISPETAELTRRIMHEVTTEGTGRRARSDRYRSFGKSGTAQHHDPVNGGYFQDRYVSSYIAAAPLEDPRVVVLVVMDDPDARIAHGGGAVAGPVAMRVFERVLEHLGVPPDAAEAEDAGGPAPSATLVRAAPAD
jgi:cell division protein FtsI (penicillin-binding protein 3)